jgi:hypothetical protein
MGTPPEVRGMRMPTPSPSLRPPIGVGGKLQPESITDIAFRVRCWNQKLPFAMDPGLRRGDGNVGAVSAKAGWR